MSCVVAGLRYYFRIYKYEYLGELMTSELHRARSMHRRHTNRARSMHRRHTNRTRSMHRRHTNRARSLHRRHTNRTRSMHRRHTNRARSMHRAVGTNRARLLLRPSTYQTWAPPKMLQRRREAVFHSAAAAYRRLEPIFWQHSHCTTD